MNTIYLLCDYLGRFGSKHDDYPYRSGMDKGKINKYFGDNNYHSIFIPFTEVKFRANEMIGAPVLYTSQEDIGYHYKSYIEDIVYGLELAGARMIPKYKYLRANNNKVFMEILRDQLDNENIKNIKSYYCGTLEEAMDISEYLTYPIVVKGYGGAMGKNVALAKDKVSLKRILKTIAATRNYKEEFKEIVRSIKYEGYKNTSTYRRKFILQEFIPDLNNDWKIYIFGEKIYVFYRPVFKHRGIRASGGGYDNYYYGLNAKFPNDLFDYAYDIYDTLDTPFVSLDIAKDNMQYYLLEYQLVYFGTAGLLKRYSSEYFVKHDDSWIHKSNHGDIEKIYVESVIEYLND